MDKQERTEIIEAMHKAIETYHKELEKCNIDPAYFVLRIEVSACGLDFEELPNEKIKITTS